MALVKQHSSSDMQTIKKHSITSNTKPIQNYQTDIGISYQQTKLCSHKSCKQSSKRFLLCLYEKLAFVLLTDNNMLNKRFEVISKCRHRNKYMLANYDSKAI